MLKGMESPYAIDTLMEQTRKLAVEYRSKTGQTLPVTSELANYDLQVLFKFHVPENSEQGVDFEGTGKFESKKIQVKSRVIFDHNKSGHRIGQLNVQGKWDYVVLVIYDSEYQVMEIYGLGRDEIIKVLDENNKKGAMSINKFKALGELLWTPEHGFE